MTTQLEDLSPTVETVQPIETAGESTGEGDAPLARSVVVRRVLAVVLSAAGAAVMAGGLFDGIAPRLEAVVAALLGCGVALVARRLEHPVTRTAAVVGGLALAAVLLVAVTHPSSVGGLQGELRTAVKAARSLRPPVPFTPGAELLLGWLMAAVGFLGTWLATEARRPGLGALAPLPVAAFAGTSIPEGQQVVSGIAVLVLLALALGCLSLEDSDGEEANGAFQLVRALRALPVLLVVTTALYGLAQTDLLFPKPAIDPSHEPQKPKTQPLSSVQDRVLFEVTSALRGPWRIGSLDVYDGHDWRLPPISQSELHEVPKDGIVDRTLRKGVSARFSIRGLSGAVLPTLPDTVGIRARGPLLAYDERNGNIRLVNGEVPQGLTYDVVAAAVPSVDRLRADRTPLPEAVRPYTRIPPAPPAVKALLARAPSTSTWDRFDFVRRHVLDTVTASGPGQPRSITPAKVQDMLAGSKVASPFEIVAAQAMLARWAGLPSRIGYGFDGGERVSDHVEVRPRHGATFVEVYFPGYKWLPVLGTPKKAKASADDTTPKQTDPNVLPSDDIAVKLLLPVATPAPSVFAKRVLQVVLVVVPVLVLGLVVFLAVPFFRKAWRRARKRTHAHSTGPRARAGAAYAQWRDTAADYGCFHPQDSPLRFLSRVADDDEHEQLAWLVTRVLWGDLADSAGHEEALHAEELSRSLQRRLAQAQPASVRVLAALSRTSLRSPYVAEGAAPHRRRRPSRVRWHRSQREAARVHDE